MTAALVMGGPSAEADVQRSAAEVAARAARLAGGWAASGLREGDVVAVLLRNGLVWGDVILACRLAGIYYCPLNWHLAPAEIRFILEDCGARMLLGDPDLIEPLRDQVPPGVPMLATGDPYEHWLAAQDAYAGPAAKPRGHMAYTSGTTGRPKGIRRHPAGPEQGPGHAAKLAEIVAATFGMAAGGRALIPAPLYHSAPSLFAQNALQLCDTVVLMERFEPEQVLALIERHRITTTYLVPIMYSRLLKLPPAVRARYDLSTLRFVASTGAPCAPEVKRAMIDWFGPVIHETYGSSEAGLVTVIGAEEALRRPGSAGRPVGDASIRILSPEGAPRATGEIGLIYVRQPAYPDFTYNNQPAARAAIERDGHFSLGDMGYLDPDGYLFICDRASDMVISGGVNLYPAEIEQALMQQPGVADCAVFGIPDAEFGESLHAVIQRAHGAGVGEADLVEGLRGRIAGFKIPRSFSFAETLPRDANGKLPKRLLRAPFWAAAGRQI